MISDPSQAISQLTADLTESQDSLNTGMHIYNTFVLSDLFGKYEIMQSTLDNIGRSLFTHIAIFAFIDDSSYTSLQVSSTASSHDC